MLLQREGSHERGFSSVTFFADIYLKAFFRDLSPYFALFLSLAAFFY